MCVQLQEHVPSIGHFMPLKRIRGPSSAPTAGNSAAAAGGTDRRLPLAQPQRTLHDTLPVPLHERIVLTTNTLDPPLGGVAGDGGRYEVILYIGSPFPMTTAGKSKLPV